jgi:tRNA pseudouridine38-40 synthase
MNTINLACGIEYDGTNYRGFQRQSPNSGLTIQGELERAIERISGHFSVVHGAGRTDAGVHASGQVISFLTPSHLSPEVWVRALNAVLPDSISVHWSREMPDRFHARFSALSRSYRYTILNSSTPSALKARYSYLFPHALDLDLMQAACLLLPGHKDFGAFGRSPNETNPLKPGPHSCVRTLREAHCFRSDDQKLIYCDFTADAFLKGQVRRMVGTLVLVGQKRLSVEAFATIVEHAEKTHPGSAAPSHGLCLVQVEYPEKFGVNDR